MAASFYFYDLETSGLSPRDARIMQFAGQRTDMDLKSVGEPHNTLLKMTEDTLPDPFSVLITGITPQQTLAKGIAEVEFLDLFYKEIALPDTIFVGYNTVRFDDEFMRYLHYRNFYDPYEWQYQDGRSRWDLLDVVRMTRALRPEGIRWPKDEQGKATNRLELLSALNELEHDNAHDALSDVKAAIAVAQIIKNNQPKLFDFLLEMRSKQKVAKLVESREPVVYTSGKYQSEYEKTTIAVMLAKHPKRQGALMYDLRYDPAKFADLTPRDLAEAWHRRKDEPGPRLPIKTLQYNRCPAIAPLSVLDETSQKRIGLTTLLARDNYQKLQQNKGFVKKILKAVGLLDKRQQLKFAEEQRVVDAQLYDGFFSESDKQILQVVRTTPPKQLAEVQTKLSDKRLRELLPLYKARNFSRDLTPEENETWEQYRTRYLLEGEESRLARYFNKIDELRQRPAISDNERYILEELQLYGESIMPES